MPNATTTTSPEEQFSELPNATTTTSPGEQFNTYEESASGLQIQYPSNWHVDETGQVTDLIVTFQPSYTLDNPSTHGPYVDFLIYKLDKASSLLKELTETIQSYNPEMYEVLEANTNSTLGGNPAFKLTTKFTDNGEKYRMLETETIVGNKAYKIAYSNLENDYQKDLPIAESMINSVRLPSN